MSVSDTPDGGWVDVRRYLSRRVLVAWAGLTLLIAGYVFASVVYVDALTPQFGPFLGLIITPLSLGVLGVIVGTLVLVIWSRRPLSAVASGLFIGIAALPTTFGCPGVGCTGTPHFVVFVEVTRLGPAISASLDAGRCAYLCPHSVELLPLAIGYLIVGSVLSQTDST